MKVFFAIFIFTISTAYAGTCSTTTRTNYSAGQTLTSSALNADFNQLVTKVNALDGGCVTDGTIESTAFDSSLDALKNGIHQGCQLSYADANTISVGKCILSVNGTFVKTIVANTVTWGCAGCSSEIASTLYYVYAKSGSSGATLNLLISTTAPNADGYDGSGNKALGKFYENSGSNIDQYSIESWANNVFVKSNSKNSTPGATREVDSFKFVFGGSAVAACTVNGACAYLSQFGDAVTKVERTAAGSYTITFKRSYVLLHCSWIPIASVNGLPGFNSILSLGSTLDITTIGDNGSAISQQDSKALVDCTGY